MFIVVTAGCGGAEMEQTLRDEADFFLDKPVDPWQLCALLGRARDADDRRSSQTTTFDGDAHYA